MTNKSAAHTDINDQGWIERYLPARMRPYAYLARLDRPIGTWLLLLPCWWAITLAAGGLVHFNSHDLYLLALFAAGALIMRAAGCTINDLWDRQLDKTVERTQNRPLAAGTVSVTGALIFTAALGAAGFLILIQLSVTAILLGLLSIPLIITYPLMKRITWWPQAFLGLTFNFGALIGWASVTMTIALPALLLYAGGFFWTLAYDTIYAHQDKDDDRKAGMKSAALKLDANSRRWIAGFFGAALFFIMAAFVTAGAGPLALAALGLPAIHFYRQIKNWDMNDHSSSLRTFRSNRNAGLLIFAAALLSF